eukprot:14523713-Ditylum_brightwellii.AAC.1
MAEEVQLECVPTSFAVNLRWLQPILDTAVCMLMRMSAAAILMEKVVARSVYHDIFSQLVGLLEEKHDGHRVSQVEVLVAVWDSAPVFVERDMA